MRTREECVMPHQRAIHWRTKPKRRTRLLSLGAAALIVWMLICFWIALGACES